MVARRARRQRAPTPRTQRARRPGLGPSIRAALVRRQIAIYLAALALGAALGLGWGDGADLLESAIYPTLGLLLYATFLQVPFGAVADGFRDRRLLGTLLIVNFLIVPVVVWALTSVVALSQAVLMGVLLTLLTPCIDYVIVFTSLAGGDSERLIAASPILMLAQILALPPLLALILGSDLDTLTDLIAVGPFLEAIGLLIALPLVAAHLTHVLAVRRPVVRRIDSAMASAMVPLMAVTLFVVVGSQMPTLGGRADEIGRVIPIYLAFLVVMVAIGVIVARLGNLDAGRGRALVFSGATRNSLVVLPIALALPAAYDVTPAIVVTQTLVELVGMVVLIRLLPRLLPDRT